MKDRRRFLAFATATGLLGVYLFARVVSATPWPHFTSILLLGLLIALAELGQVVLSPGHAVSLGGGIALAAGSMFGPAGAAWAQGVGSTTAGLLTRCPLPILLSNTAIYVSSAVIAVGAMRAFPNALPYLADRLAVGALTLCLVNSLLLTVGLVALKRSHPLTTFVDTMMGRGLLHAAAYWGLAVALVCVSERLGIVAATAVAGAAVVLNRTVASKYASRTREQAVRSLLKSAETGDRDRGGHGHRVAAYALALGRAMGVSRAERETLRYAGLLHDIGLPRALRTSETGELDLVETRSHPVRGAEMVARIGALVDVAEVIRHHHERLDGCGYPSGLAGDKIPLVARILAVADAFDTLTFPGPGRRPLSVREALGSLEAESGTLYCPRVVAAFVELAKKEDPACSALLIHRLAGDPRPDTSTVVARLQRYLYESRLAGAALGMQPGHLFWRHLLDRWGVRRGRRAEDSSDWFWVLYETSRVLGGSMDLDELVTVLCEMASMATNLASAVLLLDEAGDRLEVRQVHGGPVGVPRGMEGARLEATSGLLGLALHEGRPIQTPDAGADRRAGHPNPFASFGIRSLAVIPLRYRGKPTGALLVWDNEVRRLPRDAVRLLTILAQSAALAIENARLFAQMRARLEEISSMKAFTDMVLTNMATGILVMDREGVVQLANPEALRVFREAGLLGPDAAAEGQRAECFGALGEIALESMRLCQERAPEVMELGDRLVDVVCSPLRDNHGGAGGAAVLFRDVTDRKHLEAQLLQAEKLALVGELAAGAAHEIRNPLTCIRGFIQLLRVPGQSGDAFSQYLDIVLGEIDRIEGIVRDLLEMARPPDLRLHPEDLNQLVSDVCRLHFAEAARRGVTLRWHLCPGLPPAMVDAPRMKQVLVNIVRNALEAVGSGGNVEVSTEHLADCHQLAVKVKDDGPGISPAIRDRIFNPFFTTRPKGTGLGLSVSYGIVRNHGGHIEVENGTSGGAVFRVLLPVARRDGG